jgi:hypothetical protein
MNSCERTPNFAIKILIRGADKELEICSGRSERSEGENTY